MTWVSLHAFYQGDLDMLLLDGVRPLLNELRSASAIDGFFFLRYWDGGPHLRIRFSPTGVAQGSPGPTCPIAEKVRDLALSRLGAFMAARPSGDLPGLSSYPEEAARRAAAEGVRQYLTVPKPNNTVHEIAYRPETDRYGEGASLMAVERHFVASSRIALGLIAAGLTREQRHTVALSAIVLTWWAHRVRPAHPASVSGARDKVTGGARTGDESIAEYEARYLAARDRLQALVGRLARTADPTSTLSPHDALGTWWRTIRTVPNGRIADLCAHLFCNRLGIGHSDERYLRHLAVRTLTEEGIR
jgi:Lantibiotic biosynthesis dehydratase C-term